MEWEICKNFRRDRHWHWSSSFPVDSPMLGMVVDYRHRFYFDRHPYVSFLLINFTGQEGKEVLMKIYCVKPPRFLRSLIQMLCRK